VVIRHSVEGSIVVIVNPGEVEKHCVITTTMAIAT
jgi:hypothetical protein